MSKTIKKYLEEMKAENKYDNELVSLLIDAHAGAEEAETIAEKTIRVIEKRYVEDKKNKN